MSKIVRAALCLTLWLAGAGAAHAHIKLLKPASWIQENGNGDPQKSSPCGPAAGTGTETDAVTTYTAGEEISVEWTETVPHNGHFRIALARDRSELIDPKVNGSCQSAEIQDPPQYPILADGLFATTSDDGQRMFATKVTLPAGMTCDNCTLQVVQFMTPHPPSCFYYHCANIKIVAAGGAGAAGSAAGSGGSAAGRGAGSGGAAAVSGGSGGSAPAGGAGSAAIGGRGPSPAGSSAAGASSNPPPSVGNPPASTPVGSAGSTAAANPTPTPPGPNTPTDSGGCSVSTGSAEANSTLAALLLLGITLSLRRRRS